MKNITKREVVERLSEQCNQTQSDTKLVIESFMNSIGKALQQGRNIELRGFGRFKTKERSAHRARNPRTNEVVQVNKSFKPIFEASTLLRDRIDSKIMNKDS
ncbi:HU family DNA-binding protein [Chitinivibrio alkaliphilus]|uniref:Histone family protein DNA-binding protein n=1 Tax=Chitinivibrio alkaliphilus ACht1 TaxID=1313304 RepID=U7DCA4_9BACT|nr:HU family DNA-binding protein [Chitinivibrio alkaliphilus]ERP32055.1 histone family protein DNA-binding protein [Chitinivibrio alkaliphilus ACht1]